MWRGALLVIVAQAACGRIGFDARGDGASEAPDARPDASFSTRHWVNRNDGTPGIWYSPKLVYHDRRGTVIMYGGDTPTMAGAGMWELTTTGWVLLCDPCAPGRRNGHAMTYDVARDRIVLFGGQGGGLGDLWEWDGSSWMQITPGGAVPAHRDFAQLTYDPQRRRAVMIGGLAAGVRDDAIYEYDGTTWSLASPAGVGTVGGTGSSTVYADGRIYALRDDGTAFRDEVWMWDGAGWSQVCSLCTGRSRRAASLAYDEALGKLLLFTGFDGAEISGTMVLDGNTFRPADMLPPARDSVGVAYDRARETIVIYGGDGATCGGNCAETWELVPN